MTRGFRGSCCFIREKYIKTEENSRGKTLAQALNSGMHLDLGIACYS